MLLTLSMLATLHSTHLPALSMPPHSMHDQSHLTKIMPLPPLTPPLPHPTSPPYVCRNHVLFGGTRILQHTGDKGARLKTPDGGCLVIVLRTGVGMWVGVYVGGWWAGGRGGQV